MRFGHAALAASGVLLAALGIVVSGTKIEPPEPTFQVDASDISDAELAEAVPNASEADDTEPSAVPGESEVEADLAEPDVAIEPAQEPVPPATSTILPQAEPKRLEQADELERLPPRPPLSDSASKESGQPDKNASDDLKSTRLFKPVAPSAGTLEAQGYRIALAGIEPLPPEEKCSFEGTEWPCGVQARTAFRSWLRGRAIACNVPSQPGDQLVVAECHVGKTDLSEWLVSNGWAKPVPDGPYADAGNKASDGRKGIYGSAPTKVGIDLRRVADPQPMAFPETGPAIEEPPVAPSPVQPPLSGPFPPAPQVQQ